MASAVEAEILLPDISSRHPGVRLAVASAGVFVIALMGGAIGAALWPTTKQGTEQHVIAPVVRVVRSVASADSLADIIERSCPAVVAVTTEPPSAAAAPVQNRTGGDMTSSASARGGFLVSQDGLVLTSDVGLPSDGPISVLLNDGRQLSAVRRSTDPISGLAVLKIEGSGFPVLEFSDSNFPRVGDWGVALSSPHGSGCAAMATMVSSDFVAEGGDLRSYIRVRPELSGQPIGSPVLDQNGRVLGIVGMGRSPTVQSAISDILPAGIAAAITSDLLRSSEAPQDAFGLVIGDATPTLATRLGDARQRGAVVSMVEDGSASDRAGLQAGDVVLSANGGPVASASELVRIIGGDEDRVSLQIVRRGVKRDVELVRPPTAARMERR